MRFFLIENLKLGIEKDGWAGAVVKVTGRRVGMHPGPTASGWWLTNWIESFDFKVE